MSYPQGPSWEQLPDNFHSSFPQDFHTLEATDFHEVNNIPPSPFDDDDTLVVLRREERLQRREEPVVPATIEPTHAIVPVTEQRRPLSEVQFVTSAPAKSFVEIAIARSIIGGKQVSLLSQKENGEHQRYAIKVKSLYEPGEHTMPLLESIEPDHKKDGPGQLPLDVPLALEAALVVFNAFVEKEFPAERLKNNRLVPTHVRLLYPKP